MQKGEQSLFLIWLLGEGRNGVAGSVYRIADSLLIEVLLGEDNRLPLAVRGIDLLHGKCLANCVVDMAFAHAAHHAVNAESNFQHGCNAPFVPELVSFY